MSFKFFLILASMGRKRKKEEMKCRMTERGWHLTDCLSITRYFSDCLHVPSSDGRVLWNNQKGKNKKKRTAAKSNITSISCWFRRGGNAVSTPESLSPRLPIQALEYTRSFLSFFLSFFLHLLPPYFRYYLTRLESHRVMAVRRLVPCGLCLPGGSSTEQ